MNSLTLVFRNLLKEVAVSIFMSAALAVSFPAASHPIQKPKPVTPVKSATNQQKGSVGRSSESVRPLTRGTAVSSPNRPAQQLMCRKEGQTCSSLSSCCFDFKCVGGENAKCVGKSLQSSSVIGIQSGTLPKKSSVDLHQ